MGSRRANDIEVLSEWLGSLQINEETSTEEYERADTEMSVAPATAAAAVSRNAQAGLPKSVDQTQGGSMETGWSLKTGEEESDCSSKAIELMERTIGSQQS